MGKSKETDDLVSLLSRLEPGFLETEIFDAVARLMVVPTFVVVPVFVRREVIYVALTRRETNDMYYTNLLHPPGKIILASDENLEVVYKRLMASELPHVSVIGAPVFVEAVFTQIFRGKEIAMVHYLEIADPFDQMECFEAACLPDDVIETDGPRIVRAVSAFEHVLTSRTGV